MRSPKFLGFLVFAFILSIVIAACETERPVEYHMIVTREVTVVVVVTPTPGTTTQPTSVEQQQPTSVAVEPTPTGPTIEATVDPFPTVARNQIIVAEQLFEHGRMFWLQPREQVWVMINGANAGSGEWVVQLDSWEDGMPEYDPDLVPPEGLFQPERGFGKLWRENETLRQQLGWALDTEYGHVTTYQYFAGGEVNANGEYVPGPGQHTVVSRDGFTYRFHEASRTWSRD